MAFDTLFVQTSHVAQGRCKGTHNGVETIGEGAYQAGGIVEVDRLGTVATGLEVSTPCLWWIARDANDVVAARQELVDNALTALA